MKTKRKTIAENIFASFNSSISELRLRSSLMEREADILVLRGFVLVSIRRQIFDKIIKVMKYNPVERKIKIKAAAILCPNSMFCVRFEMILSN